MTDHGGDVPGYRTIKVTAQHDPVSALAEDEAWRAREAYPEILGAGGPVFGFAREREEGGWVVLGFGDDAPQGARDSLASTFRRLSHDARGAQDTAAAEEFAAAAARLDWEALDELTVRGCRYRVVRAEQFVRMGEDGPEPPRPSDPDPARPGEAYQVPSRITGFVIDPFVGTGMSTGILTLDLLQYVRVAGTVPRDVREDSRRATRTHPGGVLLPTEFMVSEEDGRWKPHTRSCGTPQAARDALTLYLRVMAPVMLKLSEAARGAYEAAADRFDRERGEELEVAGRRFRVVRVEQLLRLGPDGPEGPRPSDFDPDPPVEVHTQRLRDQGLLRDGGEEEEEAGAAEPDEEMKEFHRLMERELARRKAQGAARPGAPREAGS